MFSRPLTAGDLCIRETVVVPPTLALQEAARLMREQHVGALVAVDETPRGRVPVGMLTDRDIVTAVVAKDVSLHGLRVADVMSDNPLVAREDDTLLDVLSAMQRRGVRRVPVTSDAGVLEGVLALDDVLGVIAEQLQAVIAAMQAGRQRELRLRS
ncbi:MAG: CBS domain-containing protein [Rubrivivax sp.]|nr:CBS domain-containing protein [Rubrivivax sp.]